MPVSVLSTSSAVTAASAFAQPVTTSSPCPDRLAAKVTIISYVPLSSGFARYQISDRLTPLTATGPCVMASPFQVIPDIDLSTRDTTTLTATKPIEFASRLGTATDAVTLDTPSIPLKVSSSLPMVSNVMTYSHSGTSSPRSNDTT